MSEITGPNPSCPSCGQNNGEHADDCKVHKMHPREVGMFDLLMEIDKLKTEIFSLKQRVSSLEADSGPIG